MNIFLIRRLASCILCTTLACSLLACSGGGNSADGNDDTGSDVDQLTSQEKFITARGNPNLFSIMFLDEEATSSSTNNTGARRRIETWIYDGTDAKSVIFDNGYFVEELTESNANLSLDDLEIKPSDIASDITAEQIKNGYGEPYDEETQQLFGKSYHALKYQETNTHPIISFVLIDSRIAAVSVGFDMAYEPGDDEELIITPVNE
jgi:hypothetical protein